MLQGTGLYVGKSLIAMALCRYYTNRGFAVTSCKAGSMEKSFEELRNNYDIIILEGEGNPADIHLRQCGPANMETACLAKSPVLLIGDIDRGGVFAQLAGTLKILSPADRARVAGLIINKFRGDACRLDPGLKELEEITEKTVLGVLPYLHEVFLHPCDTLADWIEANLNMSFIDSLLLTGSN